MSLIVNSYQQSSAAKPLIEHLTDLGFLTNLRLCLDAGDILSAPASMTKWLDRSGNGYDFFLGTSASAQSTDPTFNGTPGGLSVDEFLSFDGGDYFTYDKSNETWMNNLHRNNALFTIMAWVWLASAGSPPQGIVSTNVTNTTASTGLVLRAGTSTNPRMYAEVKRGSSFSALTKFSLLDIPVGQWCFLAMNYDEAAGLGAFIVNDAVDDFEGTYNSPDSGGSSRTMKIGYAESNDTGIAPHSFMHDGSRIAGLTVHEGLMRSVSEVSAFYNATRTRFGV